MLEVVSRLFDLFKSKSSEPVDGDVPAHVLVQQSRDARDNVKEFVAKNAPGTF